MRVVDRHVVDALRRMRLVLMTNRKIAEKLGISAKHVGQILAGKVQFLNDETWEAMAPHIKPYIQAPEPTIPAPTDTKRCFVATHLHVLTDDQVDAIALQIIASGKPL
jgi:hypothetical protein